MTELAQREGKATLEKIDTRCIPAQLPNKPYLRFFVLLSLKFTSADFIKKEPPQCGILASKQVAHFPKIFLDTTQASCLETLALSEYVQRTRILLNYS